MGVSRIVDFKIFLWEHAPDPPTMGWTYKSYEGPGTRPPQIFHELSATGKLWARKWRWIIVYLGPGSQGITFVAST